MGLSICITHTDDEWVIAQWDDLRRAYGIEQVYVLDGPAIGPWPSVNSLGEIKQPCVWVSLGSDSVSLDEWDHPEDVCYVFGSDYKTNEQPDHTVCSIFVPSPKGREIWSTQVGSIIVHDWWSTHG